MLDTTQVLPILAENAGMVKNTPFRTNIEFAEIESLFSKLPHSELETFRRTVNVSRRTWRRWKLGQARIPVAVWLAARYVTGDMTHHHRNWSGLQIKGDSITGSPYGLVRASEVHCWPWIRALYRRNYTNHQEATPCTKQPLPPSPFLVSPAAQRPGRS